jgi:hypothetical protein
MQPGAGAAAPTWHQSGNQLSGWVQ